MPKPTTKTVAKSVPRASAPARAAPKATLQPTNVTYCDKMVVNVHNYYSQPAFAPVQNAVQRGSSSKAVATKSVVAKPAISASSVYPYGENRIMHTSSQSQPSTSRRCAAHNPAHQVPAVRSQPMQRQHQQHAVPSSWNSAGPSSSMQGYQSYGGQQFQGQHMTHQQQQHQSGRPMLVERIVYMERYTQQ